MTPVHATHSLPQAGSPSVPPSKTQASPAPSSPPSAGVPGQKAQGAAPPVPARSSQGPQTEVVAPLKGPAAILSGLRSALKDRVDIARQCWGLADMACRELQESPVHDRRSLRQYLPLVGADLQAGAHRVGAAGCAAASACWQAVVCGLGHLGTMTLLALQDLTFYGGRLGATRYVAMAIAPPVGACLGRRGVHRLMEWAARV